MDFFESQDIARRNTGRLIMLFSLAVAVLTFGTYLAVLIAYYAYYRAELATDPSFQVTLWNWRVFFLSIFLTGATIFGGSYYKTRSLSSGGRAVAESMGARRVEMGTTDRDEKRLVNVVEEMAIASGMPVPAIFVLDEEYGINAFAAGFTINDAAIAVTRGCLDYLTRDELQGIVAHEFAHILNGDMRLNIRLIGVLHGILIIFFAGRLLFYGVGQGRSNRNGGGGAVAAIFVVGLILIVVGWFGLFFGRLIKSAVSRQREFLADAAAVQFTRNPDGISGALKKIGGAKYGSRMQSTNAEELSHLFFGSHRGGRWQGSWTQNFMSTHPPLGERLRRLDPRFDGSYPAVERIVDRRAEVEAEKSRTQKSGFGDLSGGVGMAMAMAMAAEPAARPGTNSVSVGARPEDVVGSIGHATAQHLQQSREMLGGIAPDIREAMHNPLGAVALIYTLLLDKDREQRQGQASLLRTHAEQAVLAEAMRLWPSVSRLDPALRLPLIDLAIPALRELALDQYREFTANVHRLIWADQKLVLFEFILEKLLRHHLDPNFGRADQRVIKYRSLQPLLGHCHVLLSSLALVGHQDPEEARQSYHAGLARLAEVSPQDYPMIEEDDFSFEALDAALELLSLATPGVKRHVVEACAYCVLGDGEVTLEEADLLRAVCELLDCPLPPFLTSQDVSKTSPGPAPVGAASGSRT